VLAGQAFAEQVAEQPSYVAAPLADLADHGSAQPAGYALSRSVGADDGAVGARDSAG
jgi:hypothetical protein